MGWLDVIDIGLGVANAAIGASNAAKLKQLQLQGAATTLIQAVVKELRDQIFNFKQAAEAVLAGESESPKVAAGAMRLLEIRLNDSGIKPDLFQELGDKEYAVNTIRLIRDNSSRLLGQLPADERAEVDRVASAASRLPDYGFYLTSYNDGRRLRDASTIVALLGPRNSCLTRLGLGLYVYPGLGLIPGIAAAVFSGGSTSSPGWIFGGVLGLGLWIWGCVMIVRWMNGRDYAKAKKTVDELKGKIDLERFIALDVEFGDDVKARQLHEQAGMLVRSFFGESKLLPQ